QVSSSPTPLVAAGGGDRCCWPRRPARRWGYARFSILPRHGVLLFLLSSWGILGPAFHRGRRDGLGGVLGWGFNLYVGSWNSILFFLIW
uniref:Uncharacterized protein n=1 Tax=Oryza brachyantha TaxID=4533 RepID=J3L1J0_ORYBR